MPRGLRTVRFSFDEDTLTHFGGLFLIHLFCRKLQLKWRLQQHLRLPRHGNSRYQAADLLLALLYAMIGGIPRIKGSRILYYNGALQQLVGLPRFPDTSSLTRFLHTEASVLIEAIQATQEELRQLLWRCFPHTSFVLDLDSTVTTIYGRLIEGATVGYNPHKRGRPSYHPLLAFEGQTRDNWGGVLRPGAVHTSAGSLPCIQDCLTRVPPGIYRIRVRADAGFFGHELAELLDGEQVGYVIVARLTTALQRRLPGLGYKAFRPRWEAAEFRYQPYRWQRPHRFIAIRHFLSEEGPPATLFTLKRWTYHAYVTSLSLEPAWVWRFYNGRCRVELDVKALKLGLPLAKIPTRSFLANQAYCQLILLAYNVVNWFKRCCLPLECQSWNLPTLRQELLILPAQLIRKDNRNVLKLPMRYLHQRLFTSCLERLRRLRLESR